MPVMLGRRSNGLPRPLYLKGCQNNPEVQRHVEHTSQGNHRPNRRCSGIESAALEAPWRSSKNAGRPTSIATGRPYTGINPLLCEIHDSRFGFQSKWWGTFRQWKRLGGEVKRRPSDVEPGSWGCKIIFYAPVNRRRTNQETGEEEEDRFVLMRQYTVFNLDQVEGDHLDKYRVEKDVPPKIEMPHYDEAERLMAATGADIRFEGDQAYYRLPSPASAWPNHTAGDFIVMPYRERFESAEAYYETVFHELSHWSEVRLGLDPETRNYALCELVAEMSSCFVSAELGIPTGSLANHAAYLDDWLRAMKEDASFIFKASTMASKTTDVLMSFVRPAEPIEEEKPAEQVV